MQQRQACVEEQSRDAVAKASTTVKTTEELKLMFETDYKHFVQERMRWKSDFDRASQKALTNFQQIEDSLTACLNTNELNCKTLKLVLEA